MALYEFEGQEYEIETDDPAEAKNKILKHLGKTPTTVGGVAKGVAGELAAGTRVVAGAPEFIAGALGTPIQAVKQMVEGDKLNWAKAKEDATRVAAPLGKIGQGVDYLIDKFNLRDEFESSQVNNLMNSVTEGVEWVGKKTETLTGVPKEATIAALDIGMLGVGLPGIKPAYRAIEKRIAPDVAVSPSKPIVDAKGVDIINKPTPAPIIQTNQSSANYGQSLGELDKEAVTKYLSPEELADPLVQEFISVTDRVTREEKISDPDTWSPELKRAYQEQGWEAFSKLRGYTPDEINNFRRSIELTRALDEKYPQASGESYSQELSYLVQQAIAPKSINTKVVDSLQTPSINIDIKGFDDSLYNLNNITKLDLTEALNTRTELEKMGVTADLQEKFRRYDEKQAKGNETINNEVYEVNKQLNDLYAENAAMFKEGNYRSTLNPEGTVGWKEFRFKNEVKANYERIEQLKEKKSTIESRRDSKEELTPAERDLYQRYFEPQRTEIMRLSEYMKEEGIVPEFGKDPTGAFAPRKTVPKSLEDKSVLQTYKEAIVGRDYTEQMMDVNRTADAGQQRSYFVLENPQGVREVFAVSEKPDSYDIFQMRNGKTVGQVIPLPKDSFKLQAGEKIGDRTVREASVAELELNANRKYLKDYSLTMGERLADLREQARIHEYSKELIKNKDLAWKAENKYDKPPEGWRQLQYTDKMPMLREYYFPERHAEILDDFNQPPIRDAITKFNNALVTNMMLVPIAHMHNELFHWGMTKGVSGFLNPKKLAGLKGIVEAAKEVTNRGEFYKQILREGGSMMSTNIKNSILMDNYYKKSLDTFKETQTFKDLAKAAGVAPANLYAGISKFSNKSMWTVRDILYVQLIKDKMDKGLSMKEAVDSVERHMPNYRLGSRLITEGKSGRVISKALGNRHAFLFARYHAGMIGSAKNTIKDLLMMDPNVKKSKQFREGLDSAVAVAVAMGVLYPLFDSVASVVAEVLDGDGSIDPDAVHVRRPGIGHVFQTLWDISKQEKDPYAAFSILVTPTPAMSLMFESAWNYEFYNRRDIRTPGADPEIQADQYLSYLANKVPQAGQAVRATGELGTGIDGWFLRNFMDIQTKSPEQVEQMEKQVQRREATAENMNDEYEGMFFR